MRRKDRQLPEECGIEIIDRCEYGVLAVTDGQQPYCVPLSMVRVDRTLYFHCAVEGKKTEFFRKNPRAFVTFVGENETATQAFTTFYQSAMVEGTLFEVTQDEQKSEALRVLCEKFTPQLMDRFESEMTGSLSRTAVWGIDMETVTAKGKLRRSNS